MSKNILTNALAGYKAECEANNQPVVLDQFVFAYIPDLDAEADISPDETLPDEEYIVGRFPVTKKGRINPNAVVYSIILGTDVGSFDFNAIYLVNSEMNLAGAIIHLKTQTKQAADPLNGVEGDTLTRNIITPYVNASRLTQIVVDADTWQLDFNNRLTAIDERGRQNNLSLYGDASFIADGFSVSLNESDSNFIDVAKGVAYVGGLKCVNKAITALDITGVVKPKTVYLVASFQGDMTSEWKTFIEAKIADSLEQSWVENGVTYYSAPVAKLTSLGIQDLRTPDWRTKHEAENSSQLNQITAIMRQMEGKLGRVRIYMANDIDDEYLPILGQTITKSDYPDYFDYLGITDDELTLPDWSTHPYLHQASDAIPAGTTLEQQLLKHAHEANSNSTGGHSHTIDSKDLGTKTSSTDSHSHTRGSMNITGVVRTGSRKHDSVGNGNSGAFSEKGYGSSYQVFGNTGGNAWNYYDSNFNAASSWTGSTSSDPHSHTVALDSHNHTMQSAGEHEHEITVEETGADLLRPNSTAVVFAVKVKYLVPASLLVA